MSAWELGHCQFGDCDAGAQYEVKIELYHTEYIFKMPLCKEHMEFVKRILGELKKDE
jgi:hypothetical protein